MKFTEIQIEFLKSLFEFDENEFIKDAEEFKVTKKPVVDDERCSALKKDNTQCLRKKIIGNTMCTIHLKGKNNIAHVAEKKQQCTAITKAGTTCSRKAMVASEFCKTHSMEKIVSKLSDEIITNSD